DPAGDAVPDILTVGVKPDPARLLQGLKPFDRCHQLHSIIGRQGLAPGKLALLGAHPQQRRPAARPGIAAAGAVREDLDEWKLGQATSSRGSLKIMRSAV